MTSCHLGWDSKLTEKTMILSKYAIGASLLALSVAGPLTAQTPAKPDPTHIPFVLPQDIKWHASANVGEDQALLFGDPSKPGPYGLLIRELQP
jgi:hypothetical protein